jgi:hypothetical protein
VVRMPRWKAEVYPAFLLNGEKPNPEKNLARPLHDCSPDILSLLRRS